MKSVYVAVFGHYDSRGGTAAIRMTKRTKEALDVAKKRYDSEFFCLDAEYEQERPSDVDFLFVGKLWYPDDLVLEGDLVNKYTDVVAYCYPVWTVGEDLELNLQYPVELEVIRIPEDFGKEEDEKLSQLREQAKAAGLSGWSSDWTEEQLQLHKEFERKRKVYEGIKEVKKAFLAEKITTPYTNSWDDDAYGFIYIP